VEFKVTKWATPTSPMPCASCLGPVMVIAGRRKGRSEAQDQRTPCGGGCCYRRV
jgi:hypothetical protein